MAAVNPGQSFLTGLGRPKRANLAPATIPTNRQINGGHARPPSASKGSGEDKLYLVFFCLQVPNGVQMMPCHDTLSLLSSLSTNLDGLMTVPMLPELTY